MRLTLHTDYSLRVLMYVAMKGNELSTISEISEQFDISVNNLRKAVHELGQKGYLETVRGKHGGLRLMRNPGQINIGTVVRDTEQELDVLGCLQGAEYCRIQQHCVLRQALREATKAFLAVLDRYTLSDLIKPGRTLAKLLDIDFRPLADAVSA